MTCTRCQKRFKHDANTLKKKELDLRNLCKKCRAREKMPLIELLDKQLDTRVETFGQKYPEVKKEDLLELARQVAIDTFEASARQAELYGYRFVADRPPMNNLATELRELKPQVQ